MAPPHVAVLAHHALEQVGRLGVQSYERFVHYDKLWIVDPGGEDGQLLLHAVGVGGDGLSQVVGQLEQVGVFAYAVAVGRSHCTPKMSAMKLRYLYAGHKVVQVWIVRNVGNLAACKPADRPLWKCRRS